MKSIAIAAISTDAPIRLVSAVSKGGIMSDPRRIGLQQQAMRPDSVGGLSGGDEFSAAGLTVGRRLAFPSHGSLLCVPPKKMRKRVGGHAPSPLG